MKLDNDFDIHSDVDHETELVILLMIKGNQVVVIYNLISKLIELNIDRTPLGDDLVYMYHPAMDTTQVIFKGNAWLYPVAKLYDDLSPKVPIVGWSNWYLPFIRKGYLEMGMIDFDELGAEDRPAVGSLATISDFIAEKEDVEQEENEETLKALQKELEIDPGTMLGTDEGPA